MARAFFGPIESSFSPRHLSRKTWRMRARTLAARPACVRAGICLMRSKRRSDLERQQFGVVALDKCWREWGDALFKPSSLARANSSRRRESTAARPHGLDGAWRAGERPCVSPPIINEIVAHCVAAPPEGSARPRFGRDPADAGRGRARGVGDGLRDGSADAPPIRSRRDPACLGAGRHRVHRRSARSEAQREVKRALPQAIGRSGGMPWQGPRCVCDT